MDDLRQLEAELEKCELFLNSRAHESKRLPSQSNAIYPENRTAVFMERDAAVGNEQRAKPKIEKTFNDLLNLLENAPEGPVELDPSLLYSPRSSINGDEDSFPARERGTRAVFNENLEFAAPPQQRPQQPARADENATSLHEKISLSKLRALQRLEELRIEQRRAEMAECSFAPSTGRPPTGPRAAQSQLPVEERLLLAAHQRRDDVARRLQQEKEENERIECTFAPQLLAPPERHLRKPHRPPIYERLNDEWRRKEAILQEARAKADVDASFKPKINSISVQLVEQRRLCKEAEKEKEGVENAPTNQSIGKSSSSSNDNLDFQVKINPVSQRLLENSSRVPINFHRRQQHFIKKREENLQFLASEPTGEVKECSFKPHTDGTALAVLAFSDTRFDQAVELPEERWTRMAFGESQLREERLKIRKAEITAEEATFHPQLNPRSLNIAEERAYYQQKKLCAIDRDNTEVDNDLIRAVSALKISISSFKEREKEELQRRRREAIATRDLKECTFFPNTAKPRVIGYYDEYDPPVPHAELSIAAAVQDGGGRPDVLLQRIEEHRRKKEQWAERVRAQEERKELAECTFAPSINKPRSSAANSTGGGGSAAGGGVSVHATVAGMDRFLEFKALAERRHAEMEARAAKVFLTQPRSPKSRGGVTVPKPFRFASDARRQAAARQGVDT